MKEKAIKVKEYLDVICKDAKCSLDFFSDYSLLLAVMLSAQCTDKKVNVVTNKLFKEHKTLEELDRLSIEDLENYLKSLGLYKNKARYFKDIVHVLLTKYDGKVPSTKEELVKIPGVGNKTANVVLIEWFNEPQFPVDTHVFRVSKRLGFGKEDDTVLDVERKLRKEFDEDLWIDLHHKFIDFGRKKCHAISPDCGDCELKKYCNFKNKNHQ